MTLLKRLFTVWNKVVNIKSSPISHNHSLLYTSYEMVRGNILEHNSQANDNRDLLSSRGLIEDIFFKLTIKNNEGEIIHEHYVAYTCGLGSFSSPNFDSLPAPAALNRIIVHDEKASPDNVEARINVLDIFPSTINEDDGSVTYRIALSYKRSKATSHRKSITCNIKTEIENF